MKYLFPTLIILTVISAFHRVTGQPSGISLRSVIEFSDSLTGKDRRLYNGRIFTPEFPRAKGHPFLGAGEWLPGQVWYNQDNFNPVSLLYDIFRDQLILLDTSADGSRNFLVLNPEMTDRFELDNRVFVNLGWNNRINGPSMKGYYEMPYEGKASLVIRWTKTFDHSRSQETPFGEYNAAIRTRYILTNRHIYRLTGRRSLIRILEGDEEKIKGYLTENKLKIKRAGDEEIIELLRFYDRLSRE